MELIAFEQQRLVLRPASTICPVCQNNTELLTTRQAGLLFQVKSTSIRRWIAQGKAHGIRTPGGQLRVCKNSLWIYRPESLSALSPVTLITNREERHHD
jgi:hypothetical protein